MSVADVGEYGNGTIRQLIHISLALNALPAPTLGLDGVTVVDAWDSSGIPEAEFSQPIEVSMALPVSLTFELHRSRCRSIHAADPAYMRTARTSCYTGHTAVHGTQANNDLFPCAGN